MRPPLPIVALLLLLFSAPAGAADQKICVSQWWGPDGDTSVPGCRASEQDIGFIDDAANSQLRVSFDVDEVHPDTCRLEWLIRISPFRWSIGAGLVPLIDNQAGTTLGGVFVGFEPGPADPNTTHGDFLFTWSDDSRFDVHRMSAKLKLTGGPEFFWGLRPKSTFDPNTPPGADDSIDLVEIGEFRYNAFGSCVEHSSSATTDRILYSGPYSFFFCGGQCDQFDEAPFGRQLSDSSPGWVDTCPWRNNNNQRDSGGIGAMRAQSDGIGDACTCGDTNGDGRVTQVDADNLAEWSLRGCGFPLTNLPDHCIELAFLGFDPFLCDTNGDRTCNQADQLRVERALENGALDPMSPNLQKCAAASCRDSDQDFHCDAEDNCAFGSNFDQLDSGGVASDQPDGIGDICQCGDETGDGIVNASDVAAMTACLAGDVSCTALCDADQNRTCDVADVTATQLAVLGQGSLDCPESRP